VADKNSRRGKKKKKSFTSYVAWYPLYEHHTHDRSGHENHGVNHGAVYVIS